MIKGCSEAILYAAAACYDKINLFAGISHGVYQNEFELGYCKLMITLLNGGKSNASAVKFNKFYLIIDGSHAMPEQDLVDCYLKFS